MIHLDQAASSFPKPAPVLAAVQHWFTALGVGADRGDSHACREVAQGVAAARQGLARRIGVPAHRVAFTSGATESLNLFLRGFLRPGDRVLTTAFEHSSVVRPLRALQQERALELLILPPDPHGGLPVEAVRAALAARPRLLVFTHASNVTGAVLDAAAFCAAAREQGTTTLLDASQTAGLLPLDVGADAVAGSAHKGLLAPPGLGFLAVREEVAVTAQKQGGTGSSAALDQHPTTWPTAFEAGTPNTPAILGLAAALRWLDQQPAGAPLAHALARLDEFEAPLRGHPRLRLLVPPPGPRLPVSSLQHLDLDPAELGAVLAGQGVHVRSGMHCAPWLHAHLGTAPAGTLRVSTGHATTTDEVRAASAIVAGC